MTDQQQQATEQENRDQAEWEHEMKMDKIAQNHDMKGERETEGEEE
jgi:hypothetical protein